MPVIFRRLLMMARPASLFDAGMMQNWSSVWQRLLLTQIFVAKWAKQVGLRRNESSDWIGLLTGRLPRIARRVGRVLESSTKFLSQERQCGRQEVFCRNYGKRFLFQRACLPGCLLLMR